ncbi:MAG: hypothetical protein ACYDGS_05780 [Thermoleophilia bacterium]
MEKAVDAVAHGELHQSTELKGSGRINAPGQSFNRMSYSLELDAVQMRRDYNDEDIKPITVVAPQSGVTLRNQRLFESFTKAQKAGETTFASMSEAGGHQKRQEYQPGG